MQALLKKERVMQISTGQKVNSMYKNRIFSSKTWLAAGFLPWLAFAALQTHAADTPPTPGGLSRWTCNAFYLPARSIWQRTVEIEFNASAVRSVRIDGVPVYTFNIQGTTILTAVDGERIQFDPVAQTWVSDLRGVVSSQGRCDR